MLPDMGILKVTVEVEHPASRGHRSPPIMAMVDTGSEYTWLPRPVLEAMALSPERTEHFQMADGTVLERPICFAVLHVAGTSAVDHVVFGEPGDLALLGARALEGLNLRVDLVARRLVAAGPIVAAVGAR
jgi:predicted aspartyl protease